jgi:hypothetical protein
MWDDKAVRYRFERRDIYITLGILATLTFIIYAIYLFMNSSNYVYPVLNSNPAEITAIVLSPENAIKTDFNLVNHSITIDSDKSKFEILNALNRAKPYSADHPKPKWLCLLTIVKQSEKYSCKIYSSTNKGVLIYFYSHGSWGFNLGEYRSDSLGTVLESIAGNIKN